MEHKPSKKKYRGLKYMVFALLAIAAAGFSYFSNSERQVDNPQAKAKEAASSFVAGAKEHGKNLMDKAGGIKDNVGDTLAEGRDKVANMASEVTDKTKEMVQGASDAGSDLVDRVKTVAESSSDFTDRTRPTIGTDGDSEIMRSAQNERLADQASEVIAKGTQQAGTMTEDTSKYKLGTTPDSSLVDSSKALMDQASDSGVTASATPIMDQAAGYMDKRDASGASESPMEQQIAQATDKPAEEARKQMVGETSADVTAGLDRNVSDMSDKVGEMPSTRKASTEDRLQGQEATVQEESSKLRCDGKPLKGKDNGDHYIVAVCETMSIISERTGVGFDNLINKNPQVENPNLIFPNQRIWLPPRG